MKKSLIITLIALCASPVFSQNLKLDLKEGETYYQNSNSKINIKQDIMGQSMDIAMTISGSMGFTVREVEKEYYILDAKYNSLTMSSSSPMGMSEWSSEKGTDSDDIMSNILAQMKTHSFEVKMKKDGSVEEVNNLDEMFQGMFDGFPDLDPMQKEQMAAQIEQSYGEDSFIGNIEMYTAIFPEEKVKEGDSWTKEISLQSGMQMVVNNTYTLTEYGDDFFLISVNATSSTVDSEDYQDVNGMPAKYNMDGTVSGTIKVDTKTGWIKEAEIKQDIGGSIDIADNPQVPGGMSIPMEMVNTTKITDN